jgi:hypothetical protein
MLKQLIPATEEGKMKLAAGLFFFILLILRLTATTTHDEGDSNSYSFSFGVNLITFIVPLLSNTLSKRY